jgi:hypothetical protein
LGVTILTCRIERQLPTIIQCNHPNILFCTPITLLTSLVIRLRISAKHSRQAPLRELAQRVEQRNALDLAGQLSYMSAFKKMPFGRVNQYFGVDHRGISVEEGS